MMDPGDQFLEYVFNRCAREEVVTIGQGAFDHFFKGDADAINERIERFCEQHALNFFPNPRKGTYTFSLVEGD